MQTPRTTQRRPRLRRWILALILLLFVLAAYALTLRWAALRLEADMDKTLHALPVAADQSRHP
jgi:type VI protein secretion system component VasK